MPGWPFMSVFEMMFVGVGMFPGTKCFTIIVTPSFFAVFIGSDSEEEAKSKEYKSHW